MGFYLKVAGVTFGNRQEVIKKLNENEELILVREQNNEFDSSAIAVMTLKKEQIGYIPSNNAKQMAFKMDRGTKFSAIVSSVTGGGIGTNYGVNILVEEKQV